MNIPKKRRNTADLDKISNDLPNTLTAEQIPDTQLPEINSTSTTNYNKDIILGKLLKEVRATKDSLLFAIITSIKTYDIIDNTFVVTCDNAVTYSDLNTTKNVNLFNNYLQKIDSSLTFKVQLVEDKSKENIATNIAKVKEAFGGFAKIIQ